MLSRNRSRRTRRRRSDMVGVSLWKERGLGGSVVLRADDEGVVGHARQRKAEHDGVGAPLCGGCCGSDAHAGYKDRSYIEKLQVRTISIAHCAVPSAATGRARCQVAPRCPCPSHSSTAELCQSGHLPCWSLMNWKCQASYLSNCWLRIYRYEVRSIAGNSCWNGWLRVPYPAT